MPFGQLPVLEIGGQDEKIAQSYTILRYMGKELGKYDFAIYLFIHILYVYACVFVRTFAHVCVYIHVYICVCFCHFILTQSLFSGIYHTAQSRHRLQ